MIKHEAINMMKEKVLIQSLGGDKLRETNIKNWAAFYLGDLIHINDLDF